MHKANTAQVRKAKLYYTWLPDNLASQIARFTCLSTYADAASMGKKYKLLSLWKKRPYYYAFSIICLNPRIHAWTMPACLLAS